MTNQIKSAKKSKMVESPAVSGLTMLVENELEKAQVVFAVQSVLDKLQNVAESLAKLEANDILPVLDLMRVIFGPQASEQFYKTATAAIGEATESIQQTRENINIQLDKLQNGDLSNDMASDDMTNDDMSGDDEDLGGGEEVPTDMDLGGDEVPTDDFDLGSEEEDSINAAGRSRKESVEYNVNALRESSNPDAIILNAYRKAFRESRQATRAVHFVAESFAIDLSDVIDVVQEAAKAVEEGKTWKDQKGKSNKNKDWAKEREEKKKSREDREEVEEGKTWKDEKDRSKKNKDRSEDRNNKKRERPSDLDESKFGGSAPKEQPSFGKRKADPLADIPMNFKDVMKKKKSYAPVEESKDSGKKPDADKDGIPDWADKNPNKAGGKEDRKPSKKS